MFTVKFEFDETAQVLALLTGVVRIDHDTPIVAVYLAPTGAATADGTPESIGTVARATYRDLYSTLASMAQGLLMIADPELPHGEIHRMNIHTDDSENTVAVTLSPAAMFGINRIMPPQYRLTKLTNVAVVDWACVALRRVPDLREYFPHGKWATIQELERICLFRYSDAYQRAEKAGLL